MDAITGEPSYGAVYDEAGTTALSGVRIGAVNQEHGFLSGDIGGLAVGQHVRVFPNHACMTAAAYDHYNVVDGGSAIIDTWHRVNGW